VRIIFLGALKAPPGNVGKQRVAERCLERAEEVPRAHAGERGEIGAGTGGFAACGNQAAFGDDEIGTHVPFS